MFRAIAAALGSVREALIPAPGMEPDRLGVRPATAKDLDAVVILNSEMAEEHAERFDLPIGALLRSRGQFKQAIVDRKSILLVATADGEVVGYAYAYPQPKGGRQTAWVDSIFVRRKFRQSSLLEWLAPETVKLARATGAAELMTQVRSADSQMGEVLTAIGMTDRFMVLRRAGARQEYPSPLFSGGRPWVAAGQGRK